MWSADIREVRDRYRELGRSFQDAATAARSERKLPDGLWRALASEGLFRHGLEHRGQDGIRYLACALEGLSHGLRDAGACSSVISSLGLSTYLVAKVGSAVLRERLLGPLAAGDIFLATAVTEPHGGSDAQKLTCTYQRAPGGYVLRGEKWSITNAPVCDGMLVFARDADTHAPSAFVVDAAVVDRSGALRPAGMGTSPTGRVVLEDVFVPDEQLLGRPGEAISYLNDAFQRERLLLPFLFTGLMDRVLAECMSYTHARVVSGKVVAEHQYTQRRLTDMKVALEVTRSLAHRALDSYTAGRDCSVESSIAKFHGANLATELVTHAIKLQGSYGVQEGALDYLLLTGLCGTIGGGTEEVQRNTIYQGLYREHRKAARGGGAR